MRPLPYPTAVGTAGFTSYPRNQILSKTAEKVDLYGPPQYMVAIGGVNDIGSGATVAETITGMQAFEAEMSSRGISTVWLAEPGWTYGPALEQLADWTTTRPLSIDCRSSAGSSNDGVHPASYIGFATCVDAALANLGIIWSNS